MTISLNGNDIMEAIEIASIVGSVVAAVLVGLVIYLMVRPKRDRAAPVRRDDAIDAEEVIALIERMESRLAVLERAIGHEGAQPRLAARDEEDFEAAELGRDLGRMK